MNDILDMALVTQPKSDQINADDLISGPRTIAIRDVKLKMGEEQPCSIYFDGSEKVFRPCKGMRSLLMQVWGQDARQYIGKSLTVYRDPKVTFGADTVGGVRISHMSHIETEMIVPITLKRGSRKGWKVAPLKVPAIKEDVASKWANAYIAKLPTFADLAALQAFTGEKAAKLEELRTVRPELHERVAAAVVARTAELTGFDEFDATPAQDAADRILTDLKACTAAADIDALDQRTKADRAAMPEHVAALVAGEFERRRGEVGAA